MERTAWTLSGLVPCPRVALSVQFASVEPTQGTALTSLHVAILVELVFILNCLL